MRVVFWRRMPSQSDSSIAFYCWPAKPCALCEGKVWPLPLSHAKNSAASPQWSCSITSWLLWKAFIWLRAVLWTCTLTWPPTSTCSFWPRSSATTWKPASQPSWTCKRTSFTVFTLAKIESTDFVLAEIESKEFVWALPKRMPRNLQLIIDTQHRPGCTVWRSWWATICSSWYVGGLVCSQWMALKLGSLREPRAKDCAPLILTKWLRTLVRIFCFASPYLSAHSPTRVPDT